MVLLKDQIRMMILLILVTNDKNHDDRKKQFGAQENMFEQKIIKITIK